MGEAKNTGMAMAPFIISLCLWLGGLMYIIIFTSMEKLKFEEVPAVAARRYSNEKILYSGRKYADAPDIEVHFEGDLLAADYRCEAWLPIKINNLRHSRVP